jgi:hypothetical protein
MEGKEKKEYSYDKRRNYGNNIPWALVHSLV